MFANAARRIATGVIALAVSATWTGATTAAEPADYLNPSSGHRLLNSEMPPGAVGQMRLLSRGPVVGYYQPVKFIGPPGVRFALAQAGSFLPPKRSLQAGLLIGQVYRFRVTDLPGAAGAELYPTIELIDRTYPPPGLALKYPIEVRLDEEDFQAALAGQMVTRVVYLEDPQTATPIVQTEQTARPMEIAEYQDALEVADRMGRPVAIVRVGSVAPPRAPELMPQFFFGDPSWAPIEQPERISQP